MTTTYKTVTEYYTVSIKLEDISSYSFNAPLTLDENGCLAEGQIHLMIMMVQTFKGWRNKPDVSIDDESREIELKF